MSEIIGMNPGRPPQGQNQRGPEANINVNLADQPDLVCEDCGSNRFLHGIFLLKKISALVSPNGQAGIAPLGPLFYCEDCGSVPTDMLPKDVVGRTRNDRTKVSGKSGPEFTIL